MPYIIWNLMLRTKHLLHMLFLKTQAFWSSFLEFNAKLDGVTLIDICLHYSKRKFKNLYTATTTLHREERSVASIYIQVMEIKHIILLNLFVPTTLMHCCQIKSEKSIFITSEKNFLDLDFLKENKINQIKLYSFYETVSWM